jgi:Zn-dependent M16 (insulinase) family peptidase
MHLVASPLGAQRSVAFASLTEGQLVNGFRTSAVYLDDSDRPMGARFVHEASGFTLDLITIESVPQGFVWVTTYPTSDKGEPHTQEHLLLGKGAKGLSVATHEPMTLSVSTAFTQQWRTCYSFYTSAGVDVFYDELERRLDALLHPDYSDEEVRREVRNFGITEDAADKKLGLEEKGSVYNEMVSSMDQPGRRLYRAAMTATYGAGHPLQFNSGGSPDALRELTPSDIRTFHAAHYFLANMGAIVSLPASAGIDGALQHIGALLTRVERQRPSRGVMTESALPAPRPAPAAQIAFVDYPHRNPQQPGSVYLTWPAERQMDVTERTTLQLFLNVFAGDPTTNLYKRLIDSKTREIPLGAQSVSASLSEDLGMPILVGFGDVPVARMNPEEMNDLRVRVLDELTRIARWSADSPELAAFNDRVRSRLVAARRDLAKFVNSPPNFGFRSAGPGWLMQLTDLERLGGFRRSVTLKPVLEAIERQLAQPGNTWRERMSSWKLTTPPWVFAARPNPALLTEQQQARAERAATEVARLKALYAAPDDQTALARYRRDYDAATAAIDLAVARATPPKFVSNPPLTLDDPLQFRTSALPASVPLVASTFGSMTSAMTGIALRLDGIGPDRLVYLSLLPPLMTRVGVIDGGRPLSYEAMSERLRQEILSLDAAFNTNATTGRVELAVNAAGNNPAEAKRALEWMRLVLFHPDWRPENLPRLRDVVDQALSALRRTPQTAEETWVRPVAAAYWRQENPLFLTATSFMTRTHQALRLKWMLKDSTPADRTAAIAGLLELGGVSGSRADLTSRLAALARGQNPLLTEAAKDLEATLVDVPDASLAIDWPRLCQQLAADLAAGPERTLRMLDDVRKDVLRTANARMFVVGAASTQAALAPELETVVAGLDQAPVVRSRYATGRIVDARVRQRDTTATTPRYVGLLNPNSQSGVFVNSAASTRIDDTDREKLLDYLAAVVYAGGGSHTMFSKTIGAGLAYSNGLNASPVTGRVTYYAERTPDLPQTMQFVVNQMKQGKVDPGLAEYAIAMAFGGTRAANAYESRAEAMADNLADGVTPDVVRRFRTGILDLRKAGPALVDDLSRRVSTLPGRVLPGLGPPAPASADAVIFVIGPERQFASWERYLRSVDSTNPTVYRLYGRDFWLVDDEGADNRP